MSELAPLLSLTGLLVLSGFFSGSETALFSLDHDQLDAAGGRVRKLLAQPRDLLVSVLFGNLIVNVFFFALAPGLLPGDPVLAGAGALLALLVCGEILPKTFALRVPVLVARLAAAPLALLVGVLRPLRRAVGGLIEIALRAVGETERREEGITPEALGQALEHSARAGVLGLGEADLLGEIVELSSLRVREIMTPRVDVLALDLEEDEPARAAKIEDARRRRLTWLPVVRGDMDRIAGAVELRDLYAQEGRSLQQLMMPVLFVPEVASALTMLQTLRDARVAEAVVVDEWGGTAGVVSLEDLFEELVGELRVEGEDVQKPVIPLGEGRFRVQGGLSIRDWNELLGRQIVPNEFETVGGYVLAVLGRLPRAGDQVQLGGGVVGEVEEVRGRRILTVDLWPEGSAP